MTNELDTDPRQENERQRPLFNFESSKESIVSGIRVRPADLARLFDVTKQSVSAWVKEGKIILGADGMVDPRVAIHMLLLSGKSSRLRAAFLKPFLDDVDAVRKRYFALEKSLESSAEDARFYESASSESLRILELLSEQIDTVWPALCKAPDDSGRLALLDWLDAAQMHGADDAGSVLDFLPYATPDLDGPDDIDAGGVLAPAERSAAEGKGADCSLGEQENEL